MKKTIIALMALAGVAAAADYTTESLWTANFGSQYTGGYTTNLTSPGKFWDAGDVATEFGAQTRDNKRIHMAGGTYGDWGTDFELSLTLTLTGENLTAGNISELQADSNGAGDALFLGITSEGKLTLSCKEFITETIGTNKVKSYTDLSSATSTGSLSLDEKYDITLTKIGSVFTLSAGEVTVSTTLSSSNTFSGTINNIALGGDTGSGNRVPVLIESMAMSSVTLIPESPAVPEPTTATLSLLALAGLAARRRRK